MCTGSDGSSVCTNCASKCSAKASAFSWSELATPLRPTIGGLGAGTRIKFLVMRHSDLSCTHGISILSSQTLFRYSRTISRTTWTLRLQLALSTGYLEICQAFLSRFFSRTCLRIESGKEACGTLLGRVGCIVNEPGIKKSTAQYLLTVSRIVFNNVATCLSGVVDIGEDTKKDLARSRKDFLIRHHLERTTGAGDGALLTSPIREKLEPVVPRPKTEDLPRSPKKASPKNSPRSARSQSVGPGLIENRSPKRQTRTPLSAHVPHANKEELQNGPLHTERRPRPIIMQVERLSYPPVFRSHYLMLHKLMLSQITAEEVNPVIQPNRITLAAEHNQCSQYGCPLSGFRGGPNRSRTMGSRVTP
uniref:Uncharacterized protein n=1 Tax=Timema tahoe TaxID=61484 RepID=A0A7R9IJV2_9NEOP|nr:unnamed protein product [Timema tahoe]